MRPIVLFVIAAVAASAIGAASLNNVIELNIQQFGVGSGDIQTPIDDASVDFEIKAVDVGNEFKNIISACSFHTGEQDLGQGLPVGSKIICKLTGDNAGTVIAEGSKTLTEAYTPSGRLLITIDQFAFPNSNLVQNVHDVTLVVVGSDPTVVP